MNPASTKIKEELSSVADRKYAETAAYFFKTGPGQYGEGDQFIGVRVPAIRSIVRKYCAEATMQDVSVLLASPIHEERMAAVLLLVARYTSPTADEKTKKEIYSYYMKNAERMNNWDLVDLSAPRIAGEYLLDKDRSILYKLVVSKNLWKRRIAIITTHGFIRRGDFKETFKLADMLLNDTHDLMHKAAGWMLREAGKKNMQALEKYLKDRCKKMPRTMLRYAIEKFPENKRKKYLSGEKK
jgi:3-methyladenine DNA glycosylase AlkD